MSRFNLLIDCASFDQGPNPGSLDYYAVRLVKGFCEDGVFKVFVLVDEKKETRLNKLIGFDVPKIVIHQEPSKSFRAQLGRLFDVNPFKKELKEKGIDVVLKTDLYTCRYYFGKEYHQHLIVHDLYPYHTTNRNIRYYVWRLFRKILTKRVSHYISISEATRKELLRFEGKDSDVVYNSLPFDYSLKEIPIESAQNHHYILYVSRFEKFKNAETLIRAFFIIKDCVNHILYLKGDKRHPEDYLDLRKLVTDLGLDKRVVFDRELRSEGEMRYLYSHADLFVHPSLREGFGWTPIEASVLGAPVIVSDIDVMREVTCGKIPVFSPYSTEDLASKMLEIIKNPPSNEEREELKVYFLQRYSLKNQIDKMTDVIIRNIERDNIAHSYSFKA